MEPRFPYIGNGEDPLVRRAKGRADRCGYEKGRLSAASTKYIIGTVALAVFMAFFVGGIWLCMKILETGMETGDWFFGF